MSFGGVTGRARCAAFLFFGKWVREKQKLVEDQLEAESHVLGVPHDVVRAPGVIEKIEVNSFFELRMFASEVKRGLDAECDERGVLCCDSELLVAIAAPNAIVDRMHVTITPFDHIER